jgi:hypothetical protein
MGRLCGQVTAQGQDDVVNQARIDVLDFHAAAHARDGLLCGRGCWPRPPSLCLSRRAQRWDEVSMTNGALKTAWHPWAKVWQRLCAYTLQHTNVCTGEP